MHIIRYGLYKLRREIETSSKKLTDEGRECSVCGGTGGWLNLNEWQ